MKNVYALRDYDNDEIVAIYLTLSHARKIMKQNREGTYKIERTFLIEDQDMEEIDHGE